MTDPDFRFIGKPLPRAEDERLITGRGRFSDDFHLDRRDLCRDGALAASACAHRRASTLHALAMPGVLGVFTGADCARRRPQADPARSAAEDQVRHEADRPPAAKPVFIGPHMLLPADKARHVGEAVAMVVARNAARRRSMRPRRSRSTTRCCRSCCIRRMPCSRARRGSGTRWPDNISVDTVSATATQPTRPSPRPIMWSRMDVHIDRVTGVPIEPRAARRRLRRRQRPLHALCRQRRRGAAEARADADARHRARSVARAVLRRRRQFRHAQSRLRRIRPGAVGGAQAAAAGEIHGDALGSVS